MENIYPDLVIPDNLAEGFVINKALTNVSCLDAVVSDSDTNGTLQIYGCHYSGGNQFFEFTKNFEIKKGDHCVEFSKGLKDSLQLYRCHGSKGNQEWGYNITSKQLFSLSSKMCLAVESNAVVVQVCNYSAPNQASHFIL